MSYGAPIALAVLLICFVGLPYAVLTIPLARLRGLLDDGRGQLRGFSGTLTGTYQQHYVKFLMRTGSSRGQGHPALFTIHLMLFGRREGEPDLARVNVACYHRDVFKNLAKAKEPGPLYAAIGADWVTHWAAQPQVQSVLDDLFKRHRARQLTFEYNVCELGCRGLFGHPREEVKKMLDGLLVLEETLARAVQTP